MLRFLTKLINDYYWVRIDPVPMPLPKAEHDQWADHLRNKYGIPMPMTEEDKLER